MRGIPLGGPRDMASNNLQLFYLFLFLFYCCDYSVSVRTFYIYSQPACQSKGCTSLCHSISLLVTAQHYQCEWAEGGATSFTWGGNFGPWFIMSHYQMKNPHWYLFIYQHNVSREWVGIENTWMKMYLFIWSNPVNKFKIKVHSTILNEKKNG